MSLVYISSKANTILKKYLHDAGHKVKEVKETVKMDPTIATHPDIYMCALRDSVYHLSLIHIFTHPITAIIIV